VIEISWGAVAGAGVTMIAALLGLAGIAWKAIHDRMAAQKLVIEGKADLDELNRQRDHVGNIFEKLGLVEREVTEIKTQMGRVVSDIESEKRTRSETNKEINGKIDQITGKIDQLIERRNRKR